MWQKQGNIETAWPDVISETKMTPEKAQKTRLSETEREGLHASIVVGKTRRALKAADATA